MKKYLGILGGFLGSLLLLTGCSFAAKLEYDSADAAREALNTAQTVTFHCNLEDTDAADNLKADGRVAGYVENKGIINSKWIVSVDDVTWFYVRYVTDEAINDVEGVKSGSTYGFYDSNDQCLGYAQERVSDEGYWERVFLNADGSEKGYYANEDCTVIYDADGNVLVKAKGSRDLMGSFADIEIVSEEGGRQIEFMDKLALLIHIYDDLKSDYLYYD